MNSCIRLLTFSVASSKPAVVMKFDTPEPDAHNNAGRTSRTVAVRRDFDKADKEENMAQHELFDIMASTRSMRRLKPDPVPDALIYQILDAGIRAPSGTNTQNWRFVVVKDPDIKKQVATVYQKGWAQVETMYADRPRTRTHGRHNISAADQRCRLSGPEHGRGSGPAVRLPQRTAHAAGVGGPSGPPVRLEYLSGRPEHVAGVSGPGLGATLTTVASLHEEEIRAVLKLPEDISTYALLPIGYPMGRFGPVTRVPAEEVTCVDQWGTPLKKAEEELAGSYRLSLPRGAGSAEW